MSNISDPQALQRNNMGSSNQDQKFLNELINTPCGSCEDNKVNNVLSDQMQSSYNMQANTNGFQAYNEGSYRNFVNAPEPYSF